jgi:hypothetical protein
MTKPAEESESKKLVIGTVAFVVFVILVLVAISWILSRGVNDEANQKAPGSSSTQSSGSIPQEPSNPNVTGGNSGAGTGNSNDSNVPTPSPAGGTDANGVPAGQ